MICVKIICVDAESALFCFVQIYTKRYRIGHNRLLVNLADIEISLISFRFLFGTLTLYGEISKWGRLRALPVADKASNKEWPRSKFGEPNGEQQILGNRNRT